MFEVAALTTSVVFLAKACRKGERAVARRRFNSASRTDRSVAATLLEDKRRVLVLTTLVLMLSLTFRLFSFSSGANETRFSAFDDTFLRGEKRTTGCGVFDSSSFSASSIRGIVAAAMFTLDFDFMALDLPGDGV